MYQVNIYNIDWRQFVADFLPIRFRNEVNIEFMMGLLAPLIRVYGRLRNTRNKQLFLAGRQQHIAHVEGLINDRFDPGFRRIRIVDAPQQYEPFEVFQQIENKPIYFHQDTEGTDPIYLWDYEESEFGGVDFIVEVPVTLLSGTTEITAFIKKHKTPGSAVIVQEV